MMEMELPGKSRRGRPKRRFLDAVKEDMQEVGVKETDVEDRKMWRMMIRCGHPWLKGKAERRRRRRSFPFSLRPRVCYKYNKNFEKILITQLKSRLKAFNVIWRSGPTQYISELDIKKSLQRTKLTTTKVQIITRYTTKVKKTDKIKQGGPTSLVGHFTKLFEFAGLNRLKTLIFFSNSGCFLKKKKKVCNWNQLARGACGPRARSWTTLR